MPEENKGGSHPGLINIWGQTIPETIFSIDEIEYLRNLPTKLPSIEWVWAELDRVWDELSLDNQSSLGSQKYFSDFYSHPAWIMNGIFTAVDSTSHRHRKLIAKWINEAGVKCVADVGGGFGELASEIIGASPSTTVDIIEPFPSKAIEWQAQREERVRVISKLSNRYDCIVAESVLEHVEKPMELAAEMIVATSVGGFLIFHNDFTPAIKCHLPRTFHLRWTFRYVVSPLSVEYVGRVPNVGADIYRKVSNDLDMKAMMRREVLSKAIGPFLNQFLYRLVQVRRIVIRRLQ